MADYTRVVNNTKVIFKAPLSLFTIDGVSITDFSIFSAAVNPRLVLVDSSQPIGRKTTISVGVTLDYTTNFLFSGYAIVLDRGGASSIGVPWVKNGNIWLPNVWHFCFQADNGITGSQFTMEMETFGVDPRPEDIGI